MPRFQRLRISPEFRAAVRADERGIVRLAQLLDIPSYPVLSKLVSRPRFTATPLNRARLQQLASLVGFTGDVFRGRHTGWVGLRTMFATANADRFVTWLTRHLLPKLRCGDVLVMDNLRAHHDRRVALVCRRHGVRVLYLPPYSPDLNPIKPAWALQKQHVRKHAPRTADHLRRVARRARYRITPRHCGRWFAHAGYKAQPR